MPNATFTICLIISKNAVIIKTSSPPHSIVQKNISREDLLKYKIKDKNERVPLVLTYHPKLAKTSSLIHKHLPTLHSSHRLKNVFPEPLLCSFRRTRNLKDLLVNAALPIVHEDDPSTSHPPGFTKCPSKQCLLSNYSFSFSFSTSCYVIFSSSMVQAMDIFMITQQDVTKTERKL